MISIYYIYLYPFFSNTNLVVQAHVSTSPPSDLPFQGLYFQILSLTFHAQKSFTTTTINLSEGLRV